MVMELCNTSLYSALHVERLQFSEKELVRMGIEVVSALDYLHSQSPAIIHRDVKSQNVLLTDDLRIKLCDFGLVSTGVTFAGTPAYMAPELLNNGLFSKKVDVYAYAILQWEMFTGSTPFSSWDLRDIRDFVTEGKRLEIPRADFPKQCGALISRCWDHDPERRPPFSAILRALQRIHSSMREVSHLEEMTSQEVDSFDALSSQVSKK